MILAYILIAVAIPIFLIIISLVLVYLLRKEISANRYDSVKVKEGNIRIPRERTIQWKDGSDLKRKVLKHFEKMELEGWNVDQKELVPRIILQRLDQGKEIEKVNQYLLSKRPFGSPGSKWLFHPKGDYDFIMCGLATVLHLFGDDKKKLHSETSAHIAKNLIGLKVDLPISRKVPRTFGMIKESENHILMINSSYYLAGKWALDRKMDVDPEYIDRLEKETLTVIDELENPGPYEFNSKPYFGYTIDALLNLEAFGSERIKKASRRILDRFNFNYALSSITMRRFPPFRRLVKHARITSLDKDYHTSMMNMWLSFLPGNEQKKLKVTEYDHSVMAALLPYRPPDGVMAMLCSGKDEYFVRIGHGQGSSPEVYSGGPGYLISSGGTARGTASRIIARPTTVILDDDETDIKNIISISGPGKRWWNWNNTGVHWRFAVSRGPVKVPVHWIPEEENYLWKIYRRNDLAICVHSRRNIGIICILDLRSEEALQKLSEIDGDENKLRKKFVFPDGRNLTYHINSRKDQWVITSVNGKKTDRDLDTWALLEGEINGSETLKIDRYPTHQGGKGIRP